MKDFFVSFVMEYFLVLRYNFDALWQKPDLKQLQTFHKNKIDQRYSISIIYSEKKGGEIHWHQHCHHNDVEITKEHVKAAADIPFLEQFVRGKKRLQVFLFYLKCKNKLLISDTKAEMSWSHPALTRTSLWEPTVSFWEPAVKLLAVWSQPWWGYLYYWNQKKT